MKKITGILLALILTIPSSAQGVDYTKSMHSALIQLDQAEKPADLLAIYQQFERIGLKFPSEYLATYYQAYSLITYLFWTQKNSTEHLKIQQQAIQLLQQLSTYKNVDQSECETLWAYYYLFEISQEYATKGRELSIQIGQHLNQARKANPNNPRAIVLGLFLDQSTPKPFRTLKNKTEDYQLAQILFENPKKEVLTPTWGKEWLSWISSDYLTH